MKTFNRKFLAPRLSSKRSLNRRKDTFGFTVTFMAIVRRQTHFSMGVILQLTVDFLVGLLWGFCREFLLKKHICLTLEIADSKWNLTKLALVVSLPGNNFKLLILLRLKIAFSATISARMKVESSLRKITFK